MTVYILIPVRPATEGKSRLAAVLSDANRATLNRKLFRHVLATATQVLPPRQCMVLSRSREFLYEARTAGALAKLEQSDHGLNEALTQGAAAAMKLGASAILSVSSDLPFLMPEDLQAMLRAGEEAPIVIATDSQRIGTNALLIRPPLTIAYCYGSDSLAAHRRAAHAAGLTSNVIDRPGLARDIDMPEDLLSSNLIRCARR